MRILRIMQHISLDGIIQVTNDQDDFPYNDWTAPYRTPAGREAVTSLYGTHFDLLLGRRTYDLWSEFWPKAPDSPFTDAMNAATKYVATHQENKLSWGPSEAIGPDIVQNVQRIKKEDGPTLVLSGSSTITSALLQHGLADELVLAVYPVLLGTGKLLLAEGTPARAFERVQTHALVSGVTLDTYKVAGALKRG